MEKQPEEKRGIGLEREKKGKAARGLSEIGLERGKKGKAAQRKERNRAGKRKKVETNPNSRKNEK